MTDKSLSEQCACGHHHDRHQPNCADCACKGFVSCVGNPESVSAIADRYNIRANVRALSEWLSEQSVPVPVVNEWLAEKQREIERLKQELADERMMKETLFMEPLLSREYPPLDPVEMRDSNGKDIGLNVGAAMKWLVQRSRDAEAAEQRLSALRDIWIEAERFF